MKPGDLYKLRCIDYGWNKYDITERDDKEYREYIPLIEPHTAQKGMIVEAQKQLAFHIAVWVPQLNGYTFMLVEDLFKI